MVPALRRTALDDAEPVIGRAFARPVGIAGEALSGVRDTSATLSRFARARNDAVRLNLPDGQNTHGHDARFARRANLPQPCAIAVYPKSVAFPPRPAPAKRGASRSSRVLDAGCDGRIGVARRAMPTRTAKSCGPDTPRQVSSWRTMLCIAPMTVATKPGHRGEREGNRKTIARGMPDAPAEPVVTMLVWFFHLHARLRVRLAPGIPCSLSISGRERPTTRAPCAAGTRTHASSRHLTTEAARQIPAARP